MNIEKQTTIIFRFRTKNNVWSSFSKKIGKVFLIFFYKKMAKKMKIEQLTSDSDSASSITFGQVF
jgi:hypothetical protein